MVWHYVIWVKVVRQTKISYSFLTETFSEMGVGAENRQFSLDCCQKYFDGSRVYFKQEIQSGNSL